LNRLLNPWRRLLVTLCVTLAAFLSIEPALSDHSNQFPMQTGAALIAINAAATDQTQSGDNQTGGAVTPAAVHHCCATHLASLPSIAAAPSVRLVVLRDSVPLTDVNPSEIYKAGPERPPRLSALS